MTPDKVTQQLTAGVEIITEEDVSDELPEAFTLPLLDGEEDIDGDD